MKEASDATGRAVAQWQVYVIECVDGSLYTGISTDTERRYRQHAEGRGARYTRSHPPSRLLAQFPVASRSLALRVEHAIKQLDAIAKRSLCRELHADGRSIIELLDRLAPLRTVAP